MRWNTSGLPCCLGLLRCKSVLVANVFSFESFVYRASTSCSQTFPYPLLIPVASVAIFAQCVYSNRECSLNCTMCFLSSLVSEEED
jgi:hypothetical protein